MSLRIQSEYGKIRTGKNSVFGHFSRSETSRKATPQFYFLHHPHTNANIERMNHTIIFMFQTLTELHKNK